MWFYFGFRIIFSAGKGDNNAENKKCPECRGIIKLGQTELNYELEKIHVSIKKVPSSVCDKCGRSYIDGHTAEDVNRLVNRVVEDINSFSKFHPPISER